MNNTDKPITASCALFVCGICHTKTGHPHQKWCTLSFRDEPQCADCTYWQSRRKLCEHPYRKKGGG